jgi:hypothetical protein
MTHSYVLVTHSKPNDDTTTSVEFTRWGRFTDVKGIQKEMLKRLEVDFEKWLNP